MNHNREISDVSNGIFKHFSLVRLKGPSHRYEQPENNNCELVFDDSEYILFIFLYQDFV